MHNKVRIKTLRSRPRFKVYTKASKEELIQLIKKHLEHNSKAIGGYANKEFAMVRLRKEKEQFWAPQLQIRWEQDEDNIQHTVVRGIIGPRPNVWTFFMFMYGLSGALLLTLGSYALSEYIVNGESHWVWSVPVALCIGIGTYIATRIGQNLAKEHLQVLNDFVDDLFQEVEFYE